MIKGLLRSAAATSTVLVLSLSTTGSVIAAALTSASISLSDSRPSQTSSYTVAASGFTTGTSINCIQLDVGTSADGSGDAGLDLSSITLTSTSIPSSGSWSVGSVDGATDQLRATLAGGATPNASGNIVWGGVVNGGATGTYFGVLETFANVDCSTGGPIDSVIMTFTYIDGALVSLTIDPSLTFSVDAVGSGQDVYPNGAATQNTSVASTSTSIDHASAVTSSTNGVSAHDISISTNATSGYSVYIRHTGLLTNGSDTIAGGSLSGASFPAPGTEAWAWTSDDSDLSMNGAGTGLWTSFTTSDAEVATAAGVASDTVRVGHQVGISSTTPAGTYTTTIIYTAVAIY